MKKYLINWFSVLATTILMTTTVNAQTADDALQTVKEQVSAVLSDLKANKARYQQDPATLNQMIDSRIDNYFDAPVMARLVIGKHWKKADASEQTAFINEFKQLILRTYSSSLLDYTDAKVEYGKASPVKRNRSKVDVKVISPTGQTYPLTLSMLYRKGQWKCYDVAMDGLSVITSYRSSIGEEIAQKGLASVIEEIKKLNEKGETK